LLIKSFLHLLEVKPGLNADNVWTMRVSGPPGKFTTDVQRAEFFRRLGGGIQSVPGVQSTGMTLSLPLGGDTFNVGRSYIREGRPLSTEEAENALYLPITPEYFHTLQIPLIAGRAFNDQDTDKSTKVLVVNETMARRLWPGESPLGRHITIWRDEKFPREIVGVVSETKASLDDDPGDQMYVPYAQDSTWPSMSVVIRTNGDPASFSPAVRSQIRSIEKGAPVFNVRTLNDVLATSVAPRRTPMLLLSVFAGAALLLAMIGIYGVTAYYVMQRTQEIGIRMALGAQTRDVLTLVLRSGMGLAVIGV